MNTFFSTLQLFFDSGRSCTIDGNCVPHTVIGLDPALRFRLTDCTHEEDGRILRSLRPDKFAHTAHGIRIREATIAQRTSVVMRSEGSGSNGALPPLGGGVTLTQEVHTVVGLKLDGMNKMAYVWARSVDSSIGENRKWGDVRPTGLRDDVPAPYLGFPMHQAWRRGCRLLESEAGQRKPFVRPRQVKHTPTNEGSGRSGLMRHVEANSVRHDDGGYSREDTDVRFESWKNALLSAYRSARG
jgi:hypothetical protein